MVSSALPSAELTELRRTVQCSNAYSNVQHSTAHKIDSLSLIDQRAAVLCPVLLCTMSVIPSTHSHPWLDAEDRSVERRG